MGHLVRVRQKTDRKLRAGRFESGLPASKGFRKGRALHSAGYERVAVINRAAHKG
jgi:hypothetical protein